MKTYLSKIGFAAIVLLLLSGCSTSNFQSTAQQTLNAAAHGVVGADRLSAEAYRTTREVLSALSATQEQAEDVLKIFQYVRTALLYAHETLLLADDALEVWRVTGEAQSFFETLPPLAQALQSLSQVLQRAGVPVPPELVSAVRALQGLLR